ncbi:hypothetical protein Tco_1238496 [Tanacetum coccineum]
MAQLKSCDKHNQVGFLRKPNESAGFAEIVDFLRGSNLRYALTANPTIYDSLVKQFWQSAIASTKADGSLEISATIDTIRYTISEASIKDSLQLDDATRITMLPNDDLFAGMGQIGYPTDGTFTFWKSFSLQHLKAILSPPSLHWAPRPYCLLWLLVATNPTAGQEHAVQAQSPPPPIPSPTPPPIPTSTSPPPPIPSPTPPPIPTSTSPPPPIPSPTPPPIPTSTSPPPPIPTPTSPPPPPPETEPTTDEYIHAEHSPVHHHFSPSQEQAPSRMPMDDLLHTVPKLISRIDSLELDFKQTKLTMGKAIVKQQEVRIGRVSKDEEFSENKGQREGKAPMLSEETPKNLRNIEFYTQEEASLAEAIRLDSLQKEEEAKQIHLDALLAQRIAEEEELTEQQKKRKAQCVKSMLGSELQGEDFAKRMVDIVNQRKKLFAEERAKAKRNKPMTQSQLKTYMMNYLKNQGTWKINQLKKLSFAEVKEERGEFEPESVKQIESFAPISFEATKASLKRFGEELQTKTPKRLKEDKDDESKEDELTKKSGKRRKQMARKGMNTSVDENDSEDSDKVGKHEESNTGTETPINPVPVAMKTPSVATYKDYQQGEKEYTKC